MNKQIKWPLILIFAAFSFSSIAALNENPILEHVPPKQETIEKFKCGMDGLLYTLEQYPSCQKAYENYHLNRLSTSVSASCDGRDSNGVPKNLMNCTYSWKLSNGSTASGSQTHTGAWRVQGSQTYQLCPPDTYPNYTVGPNPIDPSDPNSTKACFPKFKPCPLGYYANAVTTSAAQPEQCVPIQCPAKGQAVNNIKNLQGIIPAGESGTYCDGLCNYSIQPGGISYQGEQFASGVSLGSQCGQSPVTGQKFTPLDKEKTCTEHTLSSTGATFLECLEGTDEPVPDPDSPLPTLDESKVPDEPVVDPFTGIECTTVEDKMSCVGKNVTDALTKQTKDQAKLAAERHNKMLEAQREITEYVERQQQKREDARKSDAVTMVEAIQEVNRTLQTVGGGGGAGTIVGLEGLVSAVEGIGEGVNETSVETDSEPSDGIESFYEAEYPNGFQDVWQKNKAAFENTEMNQYLESWKLTATGAAPPMQLCFNVIMDFGCKEFVIDPRIFPFLRIIMLVSTAFLCRALIFGG